jgi:hypothetical protein
VCSSFVDAVKKLGLRGATVGASIAGDESSHPKISPVLGEG